MQGTMIYGPRDIRFEDRPEPTITKPTDAIIRLSATCICGSDLWPYRGISQVAQPTPIGHEYCGIVEEVGKEVSSPASSSSVRLLPLTTLASSARTAISPRAANASS
jgi:threonine dehydrogenase-like Zn-dependent dehydrogenase